MDSKTRIMKELKELEELSKQVGLPCLIRRVHTRLLRLALSATTCATGKGRFSDQYVPRQCLGIFSQTLPMREECSR